MDTCKEYIPKEDYIANTMALTQNVLDGFGKQQEGGHSGYRRVEEGVG